MMFKRLCLVMGLAVFACPAFAGVVPKPIAPQLTIEVDQSQQEVAIDVPTTASGVGMQFGLIGALIGTAINNSQAKGAEERVVPIRDSLVGYDFNAKLEQALRAKLASENVSPDPQFLFLAPAARAEREATHGEMAARAFVLSPRYAFDYDMNTLTVRVVARLVDRERKSNGKYKERQQFLRTYQFAFPIDAPTRNAAPWVALGRKGLADLLDQGITQVTDMMAYDFSDKGRAEWDVDNRKQFARVKDRGFPGMPVRVEADYVWTRSGKHDGQILQGFQPLSGPIAVAAPAVATPVVATPAADAPVVAAQPAAQAEAAASVVPTATPVQDATPAAAAGGSN